MDYKAYIEQTCTITVRFYNGTYTASCEQFPAASWQANTPHAAYNGLIDAITEHLQKTKHTPEHSW